MVIHREWRLRALTDIWTGDARGRPDRLVPTGIVGSLRWWFEVLVRGLGGSACDPSNPEVRCPDNENARCVVCELFGCTGWARKFRLLVLAPGATGSSSDVSKAYPLGQVIYERIKAGDDFVLSFVALRPVRSQEWALLNATLRLIADYGAAGGKTVFKPSDEEGRDNLPHHKDFGLIQLVDPPPPCATEAEARGYVQSSHWREVDERAFSWASLRYFWCVLGRYLARQDAENSTFNEVLGRRTKKSVKERRGRRTVRWSDLFAKGDGEISRWLAGRPLESKKVFSFKDPECSMRTFGFVKPGLLTFDHMAERLKQVWPDFAPEKDFLTGERILQQLFCAGE